MNAKVSNPRPRQERRLRWKYGLTETQARVIAGLYYGEVK
ncbi:hypothetical protein SuNHUV7_23450 (plasmid) [Pseudoseohaeicola sp. NH-UV-7]|jgi:hypothetical protein